MKKISDVAKLILYIIIFGFVLIFVGRTIMSILFTIIGGFLIGVGITFLIKVVKDGDFYD